MAMIKCPECNKEISDQSDQCVHCGYKIKKANKKPKFIVSIIIIIIAIATTVGLVIYNSNQNKELAEDLEEIGDNSTYSVKLETIVDSMIEGGTDAEDCGNQIKSVWYNTIYEESDPKTDKYTKTNGKFNDDFNDSLSNLFEDPEFSELVSNVEDNQKEVMKKMKDMKNPPSDWEEAYLELKELYDDYLDLTNVCINPSGSLSSYSTNFNEADTNMVTSLKKVQTYLE